MTADFVLSENGSAVEHATNPTADLLAELEALLARYLVLDEAQRGTIALWTLHTHAFAAAHATPYLRVTSAVPGSGKSRLFEVISIIAANVIKTSGLSAAMLPRAIEKYKPTLLLDEIDNMLAGDKEMASTILGVLNDGYRRGGCTYKGVPTKGGDWEIKAFEVFAAKAFAGLKDLDPALSSRCIPIRMQLRKPSEQIEDFYLSEAPEEHAELVQRLSEWAPDAIERLVAIRPERLARVTDRTAEVWRPLLQIADLAAGDWPKRARGHAHALYFGERHMSEPPHALMAISKLRGLCDSKDGPVLTRDFLQALNRDEELPFAEWAAGKGINAHRLGLLLRPFGIQSRNLKMPDGRVAKGYRAEDLADVFARYLPSATSATSATSPPSKGGPVADVADVADA